MSPELEELAVKVVAAARQQGADDAECVLQCGREFSTTVRLGEIEVLKEADSRGLGVRVFVGKRSASTYSNDLGWTALEETVRAALAMARAGTEDPFSGLPEKEEQGSREAARSNGLRIFYPGTAELEPEAGIALAKACERAALDWDARIRNSEGASFEAGESHRILASTRNFLGAWSQSVCSLSAAPIAEADGKMQRDFWYALAHQRPGLEAPEAVGRTAAQRALRRLGARKPATARLPVVFDPLTARSLLEHVFQAVEGNAIYRGASFLAGKLGEAIADSAVTLVDDGCMPGGYGSRPFDAEGVASRRTVVIENGVLRSYLHNCYSARKLGQAGTGNAARGLAGTPGIAPSNLFLLPGKRSPAALLGDIKQGLYVTELIGFGFNPVTGDYSRGACGLWIENGELAYPVEEITIAGNLKEMLVHLAEIGNDLEFRGAIASPTLRIEGLTVAGA